MVYYPIGYENTEKMVRLSLIIKKEGQLMTNKDQENERLRKEVSHLRQQNLKLTVENEFVKKLNALVDARVKNRNPKK